MSTRRIRAAHQEPDDVQVTSELSSPAQAGDPVTTDLTGGDYWMPACAGMTAERMPEREGNARGTTMAIRRKATKAATRAAMKKTAARKAAGKKVVKLKPKPAGKRAAANGGLPKPSTRPYGQAGKALGGVRVLDF